jgi:ABC-type Mn2+/Zn2+ transport system ATPase subunit
MQNLHPIAAARKPVLEIKDLHVSIAGHHVLRGVNMSVPAGEVVALIGPNGSGKTTLLRAILGLQRFSSGEVKLFGQEDVQAALHRIGYVPQRINLESSFILSVREFLALRARECRYWFWRKRSEIDAALDQSLEGLGIESLLDRPVAQLSGGQLQRVLIAFSLLRKPELLLLDEPTAGVDTPGERSFYELIAQIQAEHHLSVILVSHDLSMVYRHASWVYALNGVVCCEGPPDQVLNADSLKQAYGIHVSPYHHHHHGEEGHVH